jgi:hypothetical protein
MRKFKKGDGERPKFEAYALVDGKDKNLVYISERQKPQTLIPTLPKISPHRTAVIVLPNKRGRRRWAIAKKITDALNEDKA